MYATKEIQGLIKEGNNIGQLNLARAENIGKVERLNHSIKHAIQNLQDMNNEKLEREINVIALESAIETLRRLK